MSKKDNSEQAPFVMVPFKELFRYAERKEKIFMFFGSVASVVNGVSVPIISLLLGDLSNDFINSSNFTKTGVKYGLYFLYLAIASFFASYISYWFWMTVGETLGLRYRKAYFRSLVKQNIGFYDEINPNEIASRVANECFLIQQGIGEKVANFIYTLSMTLAGFIIGFVKGWQLALVLCAMIPCFGIAGSVFVSISQRVDRIRVDAYSRGGAVAEECLNAIRTVTALCGQRRDGKRYVDKLNEGKKSLMKLFFIAAFAFGWFQFLLNIAWALGFYFGSKLIEDGTTNPVRDEPYNIGDIFAILFSIIIGNNALGQVTPAAKAFSAARDSATRALKIIDRKSEIDIDDPRGIKPTKVEGEFTFEKVTFAYPMKKEKTVLKGISFNIKKNQKTAFVGESGCGKTTSLQLIERFYDITGGSLKLDGNELKDLNLYWLRSQIGYVGQEPVLFATSIKENMLLAKENATEAEIWEALKKANAYEFVSNLPEKLETFVGMSGTQLSGGQKQRLAIARAILKNPPILLLDEATSALDRKNEREIQQTLDEISTGRTTIVIAHRLTTIQNADQIVVFDQGVVVEQGTHQELIAKKGKYYELQYLQLSAQDKDSKGKTGSEENIADANTNSSDNSKDSPQNTEVTLHTKALEKVEVNQVADSNLAEISANDLKIKIINNKRKVIQRLLKLFGPDTKWFVIGCLICIVLGSILPITTIFLSKCLDILAQPSLGDFREEINRYCLYYFICSIVALLTQTLVIHIFTSIGERHAVTLRGVVFDKLLKMPISWYDHPKNTPGALTTKLSTDCIQVNTLVSTSLPILVQVASTLVTGIIISFVSSWRIALCSIGYLPILLYGFYMQGKVQQGLSDKTDEAFKESGAFVAEAVINMRTIASFGKEDKLIETFDKILKKPVDLALKKGHDSGLAFGIAQFAIFFKYAYIFIVAGAFIEAGVLNYSDMFRAIFSIIFAAFAVGQVYQFVGDVAEAQKSAAMIFKLVDTKCEIDIDEPSQNVKTPIKGEIEFRNIWFKYPTRERQVLKGFNLKINTSSKVALVGPSGCGKSTLIGLLLRFYDPQQGQILVDGIDIKKYDLQHLRRSFGYVSQEPTLFNDTIEENIKYTKPEATEQEIKQAASEANCLRFIEANQFESNDLDPEAVKKFGTGFKRMVGPKGSQISGGQKQRIAIARAILTKPNVLLLDEATSALDAENEKVVQESLDKIMKGKTSIIVAHRISTIKDADQILVFYDGAVVETGKYDDLVSKQGFFYKLEKGLPI